MSDITKVYEKVTVAFEKLKVEEGDTIIINFPTDMNPTQMHSVSMVFETLRDKYQCDIIGLTQGITIDCISEEDMNELGWYRRKEKLN